VAGQQQILQLLGKQWLWLTLKQRQSEIFSFVSHWNCFARHNEKNQGITYKHSFHFIVYNSFENDGRVWILDVFIFKTPSFLSGCINESLQNYWHKHLKSASLRRGKNAASRYTDIRFL
jgi:hypothetical protein